MKQFTIYVSFVYVLCGNPGAAQPPKNIFGLYAPAGKSPPRPGRDSIRVTSHAQGKVNLAVKLYYANGHTCQLDKEGEWKEDHLLVVADGLNPKEACQLEARFTEGRIRLSDEGQRCAQVYCGTRGKLDGVVLNRVVSTRNRR